LLATGLCPAPAGTVAPPDESHLHHLVKITVVDLGAERPTVFRQLRTRGSMWFESLRFWLPAGLDAETVPEAVCVSAGLPATAVGSGRWRGKEAPYIDVSLPQSLPVGREAQAAVSVPIVLPEADERGYRLLELGLDPVFDGAVERTAVALPLGTDVAAIEGPVPARQRLLTGYAAYVWDHGQDPARIAVRYRLPAGGRQRLDIGELNP